MVFHNFKLGSSSVIYWCSGSVVECLTGDRGTGGSSLTGATVLCPWARHINPSLALVQPRKTCPFISERLLIGCKESNQSNKKHVLFSETSYHSLDQEPICFQNCETLTPPPSLLCFWQNKTAFKYIADPIITNQIIQCKSNPCEWSITKA